MTFRVLLVIVLPMLLQTPAADSQQPAPAKQYFIAIFSKGPAWDDSKDTSAQVGFKEHSENLRRLRTEKRIPIGGRY